MSLAKKKLERLFAPLNGSPRQRRISLGVRIRVTHVGTLYESFHEEKVIFYQMGNKGFQSGMCGCGTGTERDKWEDVAHLARLS